MRGALPIRGLNHISWSVKSVQASVAFYRDVLGFVLIKRPDSLEHDFAGACAFFRKPKKRATPARTPLPSSPCAHFRGIKRESGVLCMRVDVGPVRRPSLATRRTLNLSMHPTPLHLQRTTNTPYASHAFASTTCNKWLGIHHAGAPQDQPHTSTHDQNHHHRAVWIRPRHSPDQRRRLLVRHSRRAPQPQSRPPQLPGERLLLLDLGLRAARTLCVHACLGNRCSPCTLERFTSRQPHLPTA